MLLIQKIIALNHVPPSFANVYKKTVAGGAPRPPGTRSQSLKSVSHADIEIPQVISLSFPPKSHVCPHQKPEVPPAACHPLYTHDAATMGNDFADRNGSTLNFDVSNWNRRKRAQTQIVDNKKLLRRILSARTAYSRAQCSEEEHKRLQLRRNVPKYPLHRAARGDNMSGSASTSRLPTHPRPPSGNLERHHISSALRSSGSQDTSSVDEDVLSASPAKIRLTATTHLKPHGVKQRSVSTNPSVSSPYEPTASPESRRVLKRGSESVVDRLRAMAIDQQNDCDSDGEARE